jgi:uncharacterized protein
MKRVFADTLYWIALELIQDTWHKPALEARQRLGTAALVTTDEVLTEFLTTLAGWGAYYRQRAVQTVQDILADDNVMVLPQTRQTFLEGVDLYQGRLDKGYSLTDCISMNACRAEGITEVLTNDHHFAQEGFVVLIAQFVAPIYSAGRQSRPYVPLSYPR